MLVDTVLNYQSFMENFKGKTSDEKECLCKQVKTIMKDTKVNIETQAKNIQSQLEAKLPLNPEQLRLMNVINSIEMQMNWNKYTNLMANQN